jgi:MscS family membrane protein
MAASGAALDRPPGKERFLLQSVRTDSPRQTLSSFLRLIEEFEAAFAAYLETRDRERAENVILIAEQLISLIDLSQVPPASRREIGGETVSYLLDILGRVTLPNLDDVPDSAAFETDGPASYAIPETPFRIVRIEEGPRQGEFLFSERTVHSAPWFYRGIAKLPLRSSLPIESWTTTIRQISGPLIPTALISAVPDGLKQSVLGTPIWKIIMVVGFTLVSALLLVLWHRAVTLRASASRLAYLWCRMLSPLAILIVALGLQSFFAYQVNVAGQFSRTIDVSVTVIVSLAGAWAFWVLALAFMESIIHRQHFSEGNVHSNMLRLLARIIGVGGGVVILAYCAQEIGLPVLSILAGLGIGGLAIALAIRPTLENLIGGFILYVDKPVRIGDFCTFGDQSGMVENIGVRSTQIRALDRTVISIPNAQFADMQIINWAQCDQMLITQTIGLRYETDADQLRYVLAKIQEMFHGHPRIDSDTVRVRFAGYGASSLDVAIRVYAKTREWNDFFAIQEDVFFRIKDIVEQSGTGFAFPSQTLYLGKDDGLDTELGKKAKQEVSVWRRTGQLPFPRLAAARLKQLADSLSYPPRGSPDFNATEEELAEAGDERLSAEPPQEESGALGGEENTSDETERK